VATPDGVRRRTSGDFAVEVAASAGPTLGKRVFDLAFAIPMSIVTFPIVLFGAIGVFLSDPGPVIYRARRAGLKGKPFTLYKLRSMRRPRPGQERPKITAGKRDPRVFFFGRVIRATKIDELPQFWNVLLGDMSVVGPRPEDPQVVEEHYTPYDMETLEVLPGLTSPGSLFASTHGDDLLGEDDPEKDYVERVMPLRLAIEHIYMERQSVGYDCQVIGRTVMLIIGAFLRRKTWPEQPEVAAAKEHLATYRDAQGGE